MTDLNLFYILVLTVLSFLLTRLYITLAIRHSVLDIPNERSSHTEPTPLGGGIAFVVCIYLGFTLFTLNGTMDARLYFAMLPGLGLAALGIMDDRRSLSPGIKLVVQLLCSGAAVALLYRGGLPFGGVKATWVILLTIVGSVWFINLFNFLDGSDGYASMEAISILIPLWILSGEAVLLMAACCVGAFLFWNWPRARVFMGDAGSTTLGYILVVSGVWLHLQNMVDIRIWVIISILFWFDASYTLARRIIRKERITKAHKKHIYQRLIQSGFTHTQVLLAGLAVNASLIGVAWLLYLGLLNWMVALAIALLIMILLVVYTEQRFYFK